MPLFYLITIHSSAQIPLGYEKIEFRIGTPIFQFIADVMSFKSLLL